MLSRRTPFRYVWGFLDLGSPVPRDGDDPFVHTEEAWPHDIFPPYARGALRVLSMDVVQSLADMHQHLLMGVTGDDPSLGVHLRQLVLHKKTFLQLDDRGAMTRFAMEPTCYTDGVYMPLKSTSWIVHHVSSRAIGCMFRMDLRAGYYRRRGDTATSTLDVVPGEREEFPSLCRCVDRRQKQGLRGLRFRHECQRHRFGRHV